MRELLHSSSSSGGGKGLDKRGANGEAVPLPLRRGRSSNPTKRNILTMSDELQPRGRPSDTHKRQLLEVRDDAGRTPLQRACENGHEPAVRALLQGGASASATERSSGWSALMLAAAGGHEEVVRTLLRLAGSEQDATRLADAQVEETGQSALHLACAAGHLHVCRRLHLPPRSTSPAADRRRRRQTGEVERARVSFTMN